MLPSRLARMLLPALTALVACCGGCSERTFQVPDGRYIMQMRAPGMPAPPVKAGEDEVQLRIDKDGTMEFRDKFGNGNPMRGKIKGNDVELHFHFEGASIEGTGRIVANGRMEGTCTVSVLDVGLEKSNVIEKKLQWSLVKKE